MLFVKDFSWGGATQKKRKHTSEEINITSEFYKVWKKNKNVLGLLKGVKGLLYSALDLELISDSLI